MCVLSVVNRVTCYRWSIVCGLSVVNRVWVIGGQSCVGYRWSIGWPAIIAQSCCLLSVVNRVSVISGQSCGNLGNLINHFWEMKNMFRKLKKIITALKKPVCSTHYNHDSIDDIPNGHLETVISDQLFFEMLS